MMMFLGYLCTLFYKEKVESVIFRNHMDLHFHHRNSSLKYIIAASCFGCLLAVWQPKQLAAIYGM